MANHMKKNVVKEEPADVDTPVTGLFREDEDDEAVITEGLRVEMRGPQLKMCPA